MEAGAGVGAGVGAGAVAISDSVGMIGCLEFGN